MFERTNGIPMKKDSGRHRWMGWRQKVLRVTNTTPNTSGSPNIKHSSVMIPNFR